MSAEPAARPVHVLHRPAAIAVIVRRLDVPALPGLAVGLLRLLVVEARGYTKRAPGDPNARRIRIALIEEGRAICRKLDVLCEAIESELIDDPHWASAWQTVAGLGLLDDAFGRRLRRLR